MMYHISSFLQGAQVVRPDTKPNLDYKESLLKLLETNRSLFCNSYASNELGKEIVNRLGWRKSKLFCECIFELCRKSIDEKHLYPRMRSIYLSASITEIEQFKRYTNRSGTIFEVYVDIERCQKYDMNLFTKAESDLSKQSVLTEDVFNRCYQFAYSYWQGDVSDSSEIEYLYYGTVEVKPLHQAE